MNKKIYIVSVDADYYPAIYKFKNKELALYKYNNIKDNGDDVYFSSTTHYSAEYIDFDDDE